MRTLFFCTLILLTGCGGSLSDEQRKQIREKMELNKIVRITEVEITEAAFTKGRQMITTLESLEDDSAKIDSFLKTNEGRIRFIRPGESNARALEEQLIEAYLADESGLQLDNVQKVRNSSGDFDSLLYTKPLTRKLENGTEHLVGVWNIWLPRKELALEIGKSKN